ncbi:ATP-binding protein [Terrisporobacter sp.]
MKVSMNKRNDKKRIPLRVYFAKTTISTLLLACLISCAIVCVGILFFYHKEFTIITMLSVCTIVCFLTCFIGIHMLLNTAKDFIEPIEKVTEAVKEVTAGDFKVQIDTSHKKTQIDEMETLTENFNAMVSELNGMDYMRKDFMSNVSHEIKTPIAAIAGFTEILQSGGLSEKEQQEYVTLVHDEARRLSRLCESMLSMSRLDNQEIVRRNEPVRLDEQIRKTIIILAEKWEEKEQEFDLNLEEVVINSDPDLLSQIWINIIDNAMKYSNEKTTIHISLEQCKDSKHGCKIAVRDEGEGISKEKIEHIFDKFYQCEQSHKKQGSGLGLSIVKRIVVLLGGTIECSSQIGQGTTIYVTL